MTLLVTESIRKRSEPLKKRIPVKRTVSFSKVNIYHSHEPDNDDALQSRDKRRRYQRRGSKTPAMLLLTKTDLSKIQSKFFPYDATTSENTALNATCITRSSSLDDYNYCTSTHFNDTNSSIQQRRMSIISSLRESLELNCSMFGSGSCSSSEAVVTTTTPTTTISTNASAIRRRRLSFDLTMQAATTVCTTPWNL